MSKNNIFADKIKEAITSSTSPTQSHPVDPAINDPEIDYPRFGWDNPKYEMLEGPSFDVMAAYQDANKWLDTLKERLLIDHNLVYFSSIVHNLAHTMPERFDRFGDILHMENLMIPYPATAEFTATTPTVRDIIRVIYNILDGIKESLKIFSEVSSSEGFTNLSMATDELIADISSEYEFFYRVEGMLNNTKDMMQWDKMVYEYSNARQNLI